MTRTIGSGSKPVYIKPTTGVTASTIHNPNYYRAALLNEWGSGEPLDEMWTPDKIVAYRVILVNFTSAGSELVGNDSYIKPKFIPWHHDINVELHARCRPYLGDRSTREPCTEVPGENCPSVYGNGCGYYAYKSEASAYDHAKDTCLRGYFAVVRVLLSGKVIEHETGYRAEILEVTEILDVYECGVEMLIPTPQTNAISLREPSTTQRAAQRAAYMPHTTKMTPRLLPRPPDGYRHPTPPSSSV